jgi:cytochrome c6
MIRVGYILLSFAFFSTVLSLRQSPMPSPRRTSCERVATAGAAAVLFLTTAAPALAAESSSKDIGAGLFESNCAICHPGGSNVVGYARSKTLTRKALEANGFASESDIVTLLKNGKGVMTRYSEYTRSDGMVMPERLSEPQMYEVASWVLAQADSGWPRTK